MRFFNDYNPYEKAITAGFVSGTISGVALSLCCFLYVYSEAKKANQKNPGYKGLRDSGLILLTPVCAALIVCVCAGAGGILGAGVQFASEAGLLTNRPG